MSKKIAIQKKHNLNPIVKVNNAFQIINLVLIGAFLAVIVFYYKDHQIILSIYNEMSLILSLISACIPFFNWIVEKSDNPEFIGALISEIYLIIGLIFLNIYVATHPVFSGKPKGEYFKSFQGFYDLLEEKIYGRFDISISLASFTERLWGRQPLGKEIIEKDTYQQLIKNYRNIFFLYCFVLIFVSIFSPLAALNKVNKHSFTAIPFWITISVGAYVQVRTIFEAMVLSRQLFRKD
jgi:hypothetical protein